MRAAIETSRKSRTPRKRAWAPVRWISGLLLGFVCIAVPALAAVGFTVNSMDDGVDAVPGNGICSTTSTPPYICTLRAAVMEANRTPNAGATIMVPAGLYTLMITPHDADGEDNGDLNLAIPAGYNPGPTTIAGAGAAFTIIDANGIDRVFKVDPGRTATLAGVTVRHGYLSATNYVYGGGIYNRGTLTISHATVTLNQANTNAAPSSGLVASGGGIANEGTLTVSDAEITSNYATLNGGAAATRSGTPRAPDAGPDSGGDGGGIWNAAGMTVTTTTIGNNIAATSGGGIENYGTANLSRSTISGNSALYGGGIANRNNLFVTNSTIGSNSADAIGGGISNVGTANVYNVTIVGNQAAADISLGGSGGGVYNSNTFNLRNSVVAGNYLSGFPDYNDCTGALGMYGNNKFWKTDGCTVAPGSPGSSTFLLSLDELGPLQSNGGPTQTIALVSPSGMIDGADALQGCVDQNSVALTTDQRGYPRTAGAQCDIGAFEYGIIFADAFE